jgi:hypothetical protein
MKPVIQEEISGCGIAASATLAKVSYAEAKCVANGLGIYAEDKALWSDSDYVRRLLSALHLTTASSEAPFTTWETLPQKALLAIKWHLKNGKPFWHWVVFVRQGDEPFVLDSKKSLKNNVRRDFGRMKPKWYIEVFD